jgi:hypothetical protein
VIEVRVGEKNGVQTRGVDRQRLPIALSQAFFPLK